MPRFRPFDAGTPTLLIIPRRLARPVSAATGTGHPPSSSRQRQRRGCGSARLRSADCTKQAFHHPRCSFDCNDIDAAQGSCISRRIALKGVLAARHTAKTRGKSGTQPVGQPSGCRRPPGSQTLNAPRESGRQRQCRVCDAGGHTSGIHARLRICRISQGRIMYPSFPFRG